MPHFRSRSINALSIGIPILCIAFMLSLFLGHHTIQAATDDSQDELNRIMKKLEHTKNKIKEKTKEKKIAEQELGQVAQELRYTEVNLKKAKKNLTVTQEKVKTTQNKLTQTKVKFDSKHQQFVKRIIEIYKNRNLGALEFIFAPNQTVSLVDASYYFDRLMNNDASMIQGIQHDYTTLETETQKLEREKKTLAKLNVEIQSRETLLSSKKKQQQHYVQSLRSEIIEMERISRELEEASQEITSQIMHLAKGTEYFGSGRFIKPVNAWLSSLFGYRHHPIYKRRIFHNGIDFAAHSGTPIQAADSGVVIVAGEPARYRGYGKITVIDHGTAKNGKRVATVYAHQSRIMVSEGDHVKQGATIGLVGSTGHSTGPHLHFEIRMNGVPVNPLDYMRI